MTLPDEFLDAFAGTTTIDKPGAAPEPEPVLPVQAAPEPEPEEDDLEPAPRRRKGRMGPEATDLPPLDRPDLPDLGDGSLPGAARDLRLLSEVQVEVAVELGRVKLPLRELLALGPGAVLELDRAADAPVDVLVNGHLVARGEVVVIDGEFGVRVTAVVEQ